MARWCKLSVGLRIAIEAHKPFSIVAGPQVTVDLNRWDQCPNSARISIPRLQDTFNAASLPHIPRNWVDHVNTNTCNKYLCKHASYMQQGKIIPSFKALVDKASCFKEPPDWIRRLLPSAALMSSGVRTGDLMPGTSSGMAAMAQAWSQWQMDERWETQPVLQKKTEGKEQKHLPCDDRNHLS